MNFDFSKYTDAKVKVNENYFNRAIGNLYSNAIKFSPIDSEVTISLLSDKNWVKISVIDNGTGISLGDAQALVNGKTVVGKQGSSGEKSFGLGYQIINKVVKIHDADIEIKSKPNIGTTVSIRFKKY